MRNAARVLVFDFLAPLTVIGALLAIGFALTWPLWWVSVCSILCLLVVQGMLANFILARRDRVTVGTDDDAPGQRFVVVAVTTAAAFAAAFVGYSHWAQPDREHDADRATVVRVATTVSEATASFSPRNPEESIDRAVALMVPEQGAKYKEAFTKTASDLAAKNVTAQARTISAGVEAIGPDAASVAVVLRATQSRPNAKPDRVALALRVTLTQEDGDWRVFDVLPINPKPDQG